MTENKTKNSYLVEYNGAYCKFYPIILKLYPHPIAEYSLIQNCQSMFMEKFKLDIRDLSSLYYTTIHKSKIMIHRIKKEKIKKYGNILLS